MTTTIAPSTTTAEVVARLHGDGCALIPSVLGPDAVADLRAAIDALPTIPGDIVGGAGERTLRTTVFNRDPRFLRLVDPPLVIDAVERALGEDCHLVNQKAWRNPPGCDAGAELHTDQTVVELDEALASDQRYQPRMYVVSALLYLSDIDADIGPTRVVAGSHRSGRSPTPGESSWRGRAATPVLCRAGDVLLFRSDAWHAGSANRSQRTRYLVETAYGRRFMAQKFWPYVNFRHDEAILAQATPRQRRLLGEHPMSAYG